MGHKLQLSKFSDTTRAVIEDENGVMIATTVGDIDHEKIANEFIAAVNVMPEVKRILRCVVDKKIDNTTCLRIFEGWCEDLLKKLEGVDG